MKARVRLAADDREVEIEVEQDETADPQALADLAWGLFTKLEPGPRPEPRPAAGFQSELRPSYDAFGLEAETRFHP